MSLFKQIALDLADAMLAGSPEPSSLSSRLVETLGRQWDWLPLLAEEVARRFAGRWGSVSREELAEVVAQSSGYESAWRYDNDDKPMTRRFPLRELRQQPPPGNLPLAARLPELPTLGELADWLALYPTDMTWFGDHWRVPSNAAGEPGHHYRYRLIDKRDGSSRLIESPKSRLRAVQRKILRGLLDAVPAHDAAHGFRARRDCLSYALPHVGQAVVIRLDLRDFFASIPARRIHASMRTLGYPFAVARALTALCTNRVPGGWLRAPAVAGRLDWLERERYRSRHLPQGAPTSPALANLCAYRLDVRLAALARAMGARYTRYADDLAFSGGEQLARAAARFSVRAAAIALEEGFAVNPRKTRIMRQGSRQHLAGVVLNQHLNLARPAFDRLKAILHNCIRHGAVSQNRSAHADFRAHLAGRVAHARMLNPARGAKLQALFDGIDWDNVETQPPVP